MFVPHPGQREVLLDSSRYKVVCAGRRWGKGHLAFMEACYIILRSPPRSEVWVVSPTHPQGEVMWEKALEMMVDVTHPAFVGPGNPSGRFLRRAYSTRGYRHFLLWNGSKIWFKSGQTPNSLRGGGQNLRYLVLDEAAYLDDRVWTILRFSLVDKIGRAIFISTPNSENPLNWFYERFVMGLKHIKAPCTRCGGEGCDGCQGTGVLLLPNPRHHPDYRSWQFSSYDNPHLRREEIDALIESEGFTYADIQREIFAQFAENEGAVFTLEMIQNCEKGEYLPPREGDEYVMGVDFGQVRDFTVVVIINLRTAHVDKLERFQGPWDLQLERVASLYRMYFSPFTVVDATQVQGSILEEELRRRGVHNIQGVRFNGDIKTRLIDQLRVAIERGEITFPYDRALHAELLSYTARRLPTGHLRYGAPRSGFDDCVDALALAWEAYRQKAPRQGKTPIPVIVLGGDDVGWSRPPRARPIT